MVCAAVFLVVALVVSSSVLADSPLQLNGANISNSTTLPLTSGVTHEVVVSMCNVSNGAELQLDLRRLLYPALVSISGCSFGSGSLLSIIGWTPLATGSAQSTLTLTVSSCILSSAAVVLQGVLPQNSSITIESNIIVVSLSPFAQTLSAGFWGAGVILTGSLRLSHSTQVVVRLNTMRVESTAVSEWLAAVLLVDVQLELQSQLLIANNTVAITSTSQKRISFLALNGTIEVNHRSYCGVDGNTVTNTNNSVGAVEFIAMLSSVVRVGSPLDLVDQSVFSVSWNAVTLSSAGLWAPVAVLLQDTSLLVAQLSSVRLLANIVRLAVYPPNATARYPVALWWHNAFLNMSNGSHLTVSQWRITMVANSSETFRMYGLLLFGVRAYLGNRSVASVDGILYHATGIDSGATSSSVISLEYNNVVLTDVSFLLLTNNQALLACSGSGMNGSTSMTWWVVDAVLSSSSGVVISENVFTMECERGQWFSNVFFERLGAVVSQRSVMIIEKNTLTSNSSQQSIVLRFHNSSLSLLGQSEFVIARNTMVNTVVFSPSSDLIFLDFHLNVTDRSVLVMGLNNLTTAPASPTTFETPTANAVALVDSASEVVVECNRVNGALLTSAVSYPLFFRTITSMLTCGSCDIRTHCLKSNAVTTRTNLDGHCGCECANATDFAGPLSAAGDVMQCIGPLPESLGRSAVVLNYSQVTVTSSVTLPFASGVTNTIVILAATVSYGVTLTIDLTKLMYPATVMVKSCTMSRLSALNITGWSSIGSAAQSRGLVLRVASCTFFSAPLFISFAMPTQSYIDVSNNTMTVQDYSWGRQPNSLAIGLVSLALHNVSYLLVRHNNIISNRSSSDAACVGIMLQLVVTNCSRLNVTMNVVSLVSSAFVWLRSVAAEISSNSSVSITRNEVTGYAYTGTLRGIYAELSNFTIFADDGVVDGGSQLTISYNNLVSQSASTGLSCLRAIQLAGVGLQLVGKGPRVAIDSNVLFVTLQGTQSNGTSLFALTQINLNATDGSVITISKNVINAGAASDTSNVSIYGIAIQHWSVSLDLSSLMHLHSNMVQMDSNATITYLRPLSVENSMFSLQDGSAVVISANELSATAVEAAAVASGAGLFSSSSISVFNGSAWIFSRNAMNMSFPGSINTSLMLFLSVNLALFSSSLFLIEGTVGAVSMPGSGIWFNRSRVSLGRNSSLTIRSNVAEVAPDGIVFERTPLNLSEASDMYIAGNNWTAAMPQAVVTVVAVRGVAQGPITASTGSAVTVQCNRAGGAVPNVTSLHFPLFASYVDRSLPCGLCVRVTDCFAPSGVQSLWNFNSCTCSCRQDTSPLLLNRTTHCEGDARSGTLSPGIMTTSHAVSGSHTTVVSGSASTSGSYTIANGSVSLAFSSPTQVIVSTMSAHPPSTTSSITDGTVSTFRVVFAEAGKAFSIAVASIAATSSSPTASLAVFLQSSSSLIDVRRRCDAEPKNADAAASFGTSMVDNFFLLSLPFANTSPTVQSSIGAAVGNLCLVAVVVVITLIVSAIVAASSSRYRFSGCTLWSISCESWKRSGFPGKLIDVIMVVMQPTTTAIILAVASQPTSAAVLVVAAICALLLVAPLLWVWCHVHCACYYFAAELRRVDIPPFRLLRLSTRLHDLLWASDEVWVPLDADIGFLERYGAWFERYRRGFAAFGLTELLFCLSNAVVTAVALLVDISAACEDGWPSLTIVALNAAYTVALMVCRPYRTMYDNIVTTILSFLGLTANAIAVWAVDEALSIGFSVALLCVGIGGILVSLLHRLLPIIVVLVRRRCTLASVDLVKLGLSSDGGTSDDNKTNVKQETEVVLFALVFCIAVHNERRHNLIALL